MVDHTPTGVEMVQPLPWRRRLQLKTGDLLARLRLPQPTIHVLVAISVGIATGLGAVGFIRLLQLCTVLFFNGGHWLFSGLGRYYVLLLPALGGLIVGYFHQPPVLGEDRWRVEPFSLIRAHRH